MVEKILYLNLLPRKKDLIGSNRKGANVQLLPQIHLVVDDECIVRNILT